jgi:hypothetical protein
MPGVWEFRVTEDHLKLMKEMYVEWDDSYAYYGSPMVDPKRPYGNGDVPNDVFEILVGRGQSQEVYDKLIKFDREGDFVTGTLPDGREVTQEDLLKLHKQTAEALQVVLSTGEFKTGLYRTQRSYDRSSWARVDD